MKKITLFVFLLILASLVSCGGQVTSEKKGDKPATGSNGVKNVAAGTNFYAYQFITPKNDDSLFGFGVHIPEGFKYDEELFDKTGMIMIRSSDQKSTVSIMAVKTFPHNDAESFLEQNIIATDKNGKYGQVASEKPWTTPFPTEEDITFSEASFASADFETTIQDVPFKGQVRVNWFDATQKQAGSVGFVMSEQAPSDVWASMKPTLDTIRKSFIWLPSGGEIKGKMMRIKDIKMKADEFAQSDFDFKMLQLANGTAPGPGWETLFGEYVIGFDQETKLFYLVKNETTPSGLLPNPARQGMTLTKQLPTSLFDYVIQTTKLKKLP